MVKNAVHSQRIADRFIISSPEQDLLGRGSMGEVYRATDTHTGELVAVKALDPGVVARDPGILERFVREGEALRQLNHPNIVRMVAAVEDEGQHYLVMEYVAGGSLQDLLEAQRPGRSLPIPRVLEIALDLADALTRAHRLGIIHRDLKPANVLLAEDGTPRLTDFGIAYMAESPRLTQTGVLMGTVDYLSPEACEGEAIDERGDIWSFGVMLYEMLSGERPFGGKSLSATLTAILTQPVPDLAQGCPDAPEALVDLVYRMLEKDRGQRIPSVRLVGAELEAILKGREVPTPLRLAPGGTRFAPVTPPPAAALTQPQVAHNLPAQLTSFVGRERETAEVIQLLEATRLLTLTGPPGTGKTRLGLQVAAEVLDQFRDGVFFVDLAPIRDPGLVATTIAQVLGLGESGGQPLLDTLKNALRHKHLLLLLDNFEQIIDAALLVGELLSSSPGLRALVTSREALRIYGEQEYPVPPLTLPALDRAESLPSLSQYEAVELFTRRARAVRPDFSLTEDNAPAVAEICVRLDGLPLAIELAAARSTVLSPEMMRRRLESRLGVLVAGPRDLPARQRTLRGAIDWSYDLLDPPEKTLFARLAVFQGGRTVEAVEAVCSHGLTIDVLAGLESLLNKNLLRRIEGATEEPRFVMLKMIHEYARERLEASGEAGDLRRRHAEYFLSLAERAAPELHGARQQDWFVQLRAEQDNLRAALAWSLEEEEAELGLRLVAALRDSWYFDGHSVEGLRWTERALASGQDAPPAARAGALNAAGWLCFDTGDYSKGQTYSSEALAIYRELGDEVGTAWALVFLSASALPFPDECKEGIALCEEGLALFRDAGHKPGVMQALTVLGELGRVDGDYNLAQKAYEECLALSRETGYKLREAITLANLASVAQHRDLLEQARALVAESLALFRELGDKKYSALNLASMAGPAAAMGYPQAAARLLGASEALLEAMGIVIHAGDWSDHDWDVAAVREQLDEATFDAAWAEGRAMSLEQAVSYALEVGRPGPAAPPPAPEREAEVAAELPSFLEGADDRVPGPVFVTCESELAQLDRLLNQALSGRGQVAFITGDPGQGKTALAREFARQARAQHPDLVTASGNCNAYTGIGDPYLPFREILELLCGDIESHWEARAISREHAIRLWQCLPLAVQALVESGRDLVDVFITGDTLTRRLSALPTWRERGKWLPKLEQLVQHKATMPADLSFQQAALFEQYSRVLQAIARQRPLLLILDDLQWADSGSTNLLFHLGKRIVGSRILILGTYRPNELALGRGGERHPLEPIVNEFKRQFGEAQIGLGKGSGRRFVDAFVDSEPNRLGEEFRATLARVTGGHPLGTVELLRDMQERGGLEQDGEGRWVEGRELDWDALPARVEAVIAERIERLDPTQRQTLKVASVEGETFTAEVVAQVLGEELQSILSLLSNELDRRHGLVSAQKIRQVDGRRLSIYRFQHILFQRYLHGSLDAVERANLHQAVGAVLQDLYAEGRKEISGQLARHFQEAGTNVQAADYQVQAGDLAVERYAYQEAVDHYQQAQAAFERALGNAWDPLERADLEHKIGEALFRKGSHPQALEHLSKALLHLDWPLPTSRWGVRLAILAELLKQLWHRLTPGLLVKPGARQVSPRLLLWLRIAGTIGLAEKYSNPEGLFLIVLRTLNLSESSGMLEGIIAGSAVFALIMEYSGLFGLAERYHQRAVTLAEESQDPRNLAHAYMGMSNHQICLGKPDAALAFAVRSANAYRQAGDIHQKCFLEFHQAQQLTVQGRFAQALAIGKNLVMQGCERVDPQIQCWGLTVQGDILRRSGDIPEAIKVLEEAVELGNTIPDYEDRIEAGAELGRCFVRLGQIEKALSVLEETRRVYTEHGTTWGNEIALYSGLAEAALWIAEQDTMHQKANLSRANQACREALEHARKSRVRLPDVMRIRATCLWLSGDRKAAQKMWEQCLKLAQEQGQYYDEGVILLDMGSRLGDRSHLEKAIKILSEVGAEWDLARAHETLGKLSDQD